MPETDPKTAEDAGKSIDIPIAQFLRAAFLRTENPVFLVAWKSRRILACTASVQRVFGYTPEELQGRTTEALHLDREQFEKFGEMTEPLLAETQLSFHTRYRMRRKDGSTFISENFLTVVRDDTDNPVAAISVVHDLSQAAGSAEIVTDPEFHLNSLMGNLPGGIFQRVREKDGSIRFNFLRGNILRQLGIDPVDAQQDSSRLFRKMHPDDRVMYNSTLEHSCETLQPADVVLRYFDNNENVHYLRSIAQPRRMDDGTTVWDGIVLDVSSERKAEESLRYAAFHDSLTGLPNLPAFRDHLKLAIDRAQVNRHRIAVAIVNLSRFRLINEVHGLEVGDTLIQAVAEKLSKAVGTTDVVARFHNDEFLVLVDNVPADEDLSASLHGLLSVFNDAFELPFHEPILLNANIGIAIFPGDADSELMLLNRAETALQYARRKEHAEIAFYQPSMTEDLLEHIELEKSLAAAIDADEPEFFLQPQYSLNERYLIGFEALARWNHKDEWISPARFIAVAEDSGLIFDLSRLMLKKLLRNIRDWRKAGLNVPKVSVNFSPLQFDNIELGEQLLADLEEYGLDQSAIRIEITESTFFRDFESKERFIGLLHEQGWEFSLDDFGTGYSSLSYLSRLPFSTLKIDRSFIHAMPKDARSKALVHSIIDMGKALGLYLIAEGAEDEMQLEMLKEMGCDGVQGFVLGRPMPCSEIPDFLPRQ